MLRSRHFVRPRGPGGAAPARRANSPRTRSTSLQTEAAGAPHPEAFGPFRVLHQVGAGTLGPVFRAYHPDEDKLVAVKLFTLDLPPDQVHRLVGELRLLVDSDLAHPAIAAPLSADVIGVDAYLAMDFVTAESVDAVIRAHGPAPAADALRVTIQIAGALDFAADSQIVHGALHPRDLLVSTDDARVTGFGIARALERIGVATPVRRPYTAPERAAAAAWDRRADIFSLAAIAHELLWGRRLTAIGEAAASALTDIAGFDLETLRIVFARALAENPSDRFETATAFAEALQTASTLAARPLASEASAAAPAVEAPPVAALSAAESPAHAAVVEEELRLPFERSEPEKDLDVANLFASEAAREPHESAEPDIAEPDVNLQPSPPPEPPVRPPFAFDRDDAALGRGSIPVPPSLDFGEAALERSRSAVWPLTLALAVGVAVGFALGYGVAGRPRSTMTLGAQSPQSAAAATSGTAPRGVSETEVRLPPASLSVGAELAPPPEGRPGSASMALDGRPVPATAEPAGPPASARPPASAVGRILVRSTPSGATAFVDGKDVGRTPVTVREVERGAHTVRVARDGYRTEERRVSVTSARPAQSVTVDLTRARPALPAPATRANLGRANGPLSVESRPSGASVFLDGKLIGKTPLMLSEVGAGDHSLAMDLNGYRRWSASVRVVAGERARITASLER